MKGQIIEVAEGQDFKVMEPDWRLAFQLLYGFCLGNGLGNKIKECAEIQQIIQPKYMVRQK